jgi:MFS transporter, YNFM family, putative membrane transport protein
VIADNVSKAAAAPSKSGLSPLRRRIAIFLLGFCALLNIYATQPLLADLAKVFAVGAAQTAWSITATTFGIALFAPIAGSVSDYAGRKNLMLAAILGMAIATLCCAGAWSFPSLVALRFIQGLFIPFIFAVAVAYIAEEWAPAQSPGVTALYVSGSVFGGFCGRFLSGCAAWLFDWRSAFLLLGGVSLAALLVVFAWLPGERLFVANKRLSGATGEIAAHFRNRQLMTTCLVGALIMFVQVTSFTYAGLHLAGPPFLLNTFQIGSIFAVFLVGVVMTPIAGRMIARAGRVATFTAAGCASLVGLALMMVSSATAVVIGLAFCSTGVFAGQACATGYAAASAPRAKSSAVGLYLTCYYLGGGAGAIVPAPLYLRWGWQACVALMALAVGLAMLLAARNWDNAARDSQL